MNDIFSIIKSAYQSLWQIKNHGNTIELITPVATTNNMFVSVFVTQRGVDYIVTDGGWLQSDMYECGFNLSGLVYHKVFNYYKENFEILETQSGGRVFYFKRIRNLDMLPNAVFDVSSFIGSAVSAFGISYGADRVENLFKIRARKILDTLYDNNTFDYDQPINNKQNIRFNALSHFDGKLQLYSFVSGSTSTYYAGSLCRSMANFQMIENQKANYRINKCVTILDDSRPNICNSSQVRNYTDFLYEKVNEENLVLPFSNVQYLKKVIC